MKTLYLLAIIGIIVVTLIMVSSGFKITTLDKIPMKDFNKAIIIMIK
jgi:hypothetical protein